MVPILKFQNSHGSLKHRDDFVSFVSKTLTLYAGPKVEKLFIHFLYDRPHRFRADDWIRFATERNVEELYLDINFGYNLHESIYYNSSLRILNTNGCGFLNQNRYNVSWTSLNVLSIGNIRLYNDIVKNMLSGCPNLEFLRFYCFYCDGYSSDLTGSSSSLKELVIEDFLGSKDTLIEFWGPNIHSFSIIGYTQGTRFKLITYDMPSLVDANLSFYVLPSIISTMLHGYETETSLLKELLAKFHYVQKLTIGPFCLQASLLTLNYFISFY